MLFAAAGSCPEAEATLSSYPRYSPPTQEPADAGLQMHSAHHGRELLMRAGWTSTRDGLECKTAHACLYVGRRAVICNLHKLNFSLVPLLICQSLQVAEQQ